MHARPQFVDGMQRGGCSTHSSLSTRTKSLPNRRRRPGRQHVGMRALCAPGPRRRACEPDHLQRRRWPGRHARRAPHSDGAAGHVQPACRRRRRTVRRHRRTSWTRSLRSTPPTARNSPKPQPRSPTTSRNCCPSTTIPPRIGSTCVRPTRAGPRSRPCATGPRPPRDGLTGSRVGHRVQAHRSRAGTLARRQRDQSLLGCGGLPERADGDGPETGAERQGLLAGIQHDAGL